MKIAIFHNLEKGGALNSLISPLKYLKNGNVVDIFSFKNNVPKNLFNNLYLYKLKKTSNITQHLKQVLFDLKRSHKKIAKEIDDNNYDLILIFPCLLTQTPYLMRYLKNKNKVIYFFNESKREFYENTSYDYYSIKKIISRFLRLPIKFIDKSNCKEAKHIISNSQYTANNLFKIYKKKSEVIYPGLKPITPQKITIKNNKKILSVGLLSKIKGHDYSIKQLKEISPDFTILGRETSESKYIFNLAKKNEVFLNIIKTENDKVKDDLFKYYSIYLANQTKEPFGITTLEATSNNCFIIGKNEGGTQEIIRNGINGLLYSNLKEARTIVRKILNKKIITFYRLNIIDWKYTTDKILDYYNHNIKDQS